MASETTTTDAASTVLDESSGIPDLIRDAIERLGDSAHVERVYGDPVTVGDRTVVPVARVADGFGSGFGSGTDAGADGEAPESGEGGGIGGGVRATPLGALEITPDGTRFVRFSDVAGKRLARLSFAVGVGYLLERPLGRR